MNFNDLSIASFLQSTTPSYRWGFHVLGIGGVLGGRLCYEYVTPVKNKQESEECRDPTIEDDLKPL